MVPIPRIGEATTSIGLAPTPLAVGSTNQGSSHPKRSMTRPPITSSQWTVSDSFARVSAAVAGRSISVAAVRPTTRSGTVGHPHAEQTHRAEGEDDDQHGEDDRV